MAQAARNLVTATPTSFGPKGSMLDLSGSDVTLSPSAKAIMVCGAGNLVYRPVGNTGADYITVTGAAVGFIPGHVVGLVRSTANGTTATVCTIEDR